MQSQKRKDAADLKQRIKQLEKSLEMEKTVILNSFLTSYFRTRHHLPSYHNNYKRKEIKRLPTVSIHVSAGISWSSWTSLLMTPLAFCFTLPTNGCFSSI